MKKFLVYTLMAMLIPLSASASEKENGLSLKITSITQERSKDNHAQKEEFSLTGTTLKYKETVSGYLRIIGVQDQEKEITVSEESINKINELALKLKECHKEDVAYATDEIGVFYIITIEIAQNEKTETIKISGMSKYLNDNTLYKQYQGFISNIKHLVLNN